jgi:hypothetical protein
MYAETLWFENVMMDNIRINIEYIITHYVTKFQTKPSHVAFVVDKATLGKSERFLLLKYFF